MTRKMKEQEQERNGKHLPTETERKGSPLSPSLFLISAFSDLICTMEIIVSTQVSYGKDVKMPCTPKSLIKNKTLSSWSTF